jgi:mannitol-1-/sugar-/sorbitol-6-phosphatase
VKAVLSDFDGVLVDSEASVMRGWRRWAAANGVAAERLERNLHGRPGADVIAELAPQLDPAAENEELERLQASDSDDVVALPGAVELLADPPAPVAIVTSGTLSLVRSRLVPAGLAEPAVLITVDRITCGKPDPEGYLLAAAELGVDPAGCVVLEDAPAGIEAGLAAGAHVVGIATTHAPSELGRAHEVFGSVAEWLATRASSRRP